MNTAPRAAAVEWAAGQHRGDSVSTAWRADAVERAAEHDGDGAATWWGASGKGGVAAATADGVVSVGREDAGMAVTCAAGSAVVLDDAAVVLGGRTIWQHACFCIPAGALFGLIGPNGTGKTTLLRVLLGQLKPSAGAVTVLGGRPRRGNAAIGYVPQRRTLEADLALRGRDLVLLGLTGHRWGFSRASKQERQAVADALRAVGADAYADQPVGILSGGEQQRLLIAQALLTQPQLLLLDEPLASLDLRSQHEIVHLVDQLRRERRIAVVFVSHDLNPLLEVLDSLIYILDGQPVAGTLDDVLESGLLSRLYATDVHVHQTPDGHRFVVGA